MSGGIPLDEGQLPEIELRHQTNQSSKLDCKHVKVLLTDANIATGQFSETLLGYGEPIKAFDHQARMINFVDANDAETIIGNYSNLITFLDSSFGCIPNKVYTFLTGGNQVTFTASCSGLPFFTITGGRGKYFGAEGVFEVMIPTEGTFTHTINICSFNDSDNGKRKSGKA